MSDTPIADFYTRIPVVGPFAEWFWSFEGMAVWMPTFALVLMVYGLARCVAYLLTPNAVLLERELERALETAPEDGARQRRIEELARRVIEAREGKGG